MTQTAPARLLIVGPPGAGKGTQATDLGKKVQEITAAGELVPDSLTNELVQDRIGQDDAKGGFLLDGYPRTLGQVEFLTGLLEAEGQAIDAVVQLEVDTDAVVARLLKRAQELGRVDDTEEVIRHRQDVYANETAPILGVYEQRGSLVKVDGMGSVEEVAQRILDALEARVPRA
jgi:adenylate kinase